MPRQRVGLSTIIRKSQVDMGSVVSDLQAATPEMLERSSLEEKTAFFVELVNAMSPEEAADFTRNLKAAAASAPDGPEMSAEDKAMLQSLVNAL